MEVKLQSSKVLTPREEKALDSEIDSLKDIVNEKELMQGVSMEAKDKVLVAKRIGELERIRNEQSAPVLSATDRERVLKEVSILEAELRRDMPTWKEYESLRPKDGPRYVAMVRQIQKWEKDPLRAQKVRRWQTLKRLLEPEDPNAGSTMYLFPQ